MSEGRRFNQALGTKHQAPNQIRIQEPEFRIQETKNIKCVFPFWLLTPYSMPYAPCSLLSIGFLPAFAINEMEIAGIDKNPGTLPHDENRISPVNGITE